MFNDREDAAEQLAGKLLRYKNRPGALVLAIPRGGIILGYALAAKLGLPLDMILAKKIGAPQDPEFAIGAVNLSSEWIDEESAGRSGASKEYLDQEIRRIRQRLKQQDELYRNGRPPLSLKGKTVLLTDDGVATGNTLIAAIRIARKEQAGKIIVSVPVGSPRTMGAIRSLADETVCLMEPEDFFSIGQYYRHFKQIEDGEAIALLRQPPRS